MSTLKAFVKSAAPVKVAKSKTDPVVRGRKSTLDQATIMRTNASGNGFIVHLTVTATQRLKLAPGDKVLMAYDAESGKVAFRKSKRGDHVCQAHGANPRRVKWGITKFLKYYDLIGSIVTDTVSADLSTVTIDGKKWQVF